MPIFEFWKESIRDIMFVSRQSFPVTTFVLLDNFILAAALFVTSLNVPGDLPILWIARLKAVEDLLAHLGPVLTAVRNHPPL